MGGSWLWLVSLLLVVGSVFFVATEFAMVSARKGRIEALARKGNKTAKLLHKELQDLSPYVAGTQVAITMVSIGVGSVTEPLITDSLSGLLGAQVDRSVSFSISFLIVTFILVVVGELVPKYLSLRVPEKVALLTIRPLKFSITVLSPLIWLVHSSAGLVLRVFGMNIDDSERDGIAKEELVMLVQSGGAEGTLEKTHAEMVARALRLDALAAHDIMIHRLDIKWIDASLTRDQLLAKLQEIPFTRLPVCRGDIDDMVGIAYLHDIVKNLDAPEFSLERIARPLVAVPENLTMEKIVATMRDNQIQMLIVMDEYGGTSGLVTLEDVVEEVFGELEDRLESERPQIERLPGGRVSARAEVRLDELVANLGMHASMADSTETLATIIVNTLGRVPRPGDSIETRIGLLRVENMARRRITRVSIQLDPAALQEP